MIWTVIKGMRINACMTEWMILKRKFNHLPLLRKIQNSHNMRKGKGRFGKTQWSKNKTKQV